MTRNVIPVDLNSILCRSEGTLARMHKALGQDTQAHKYWAAQDRRKKALYTFFWDPHESQWRDILMGMPV
jgi:neutral trehalase